MMEDPFDNELHLFGVSEEPLDFEPEGLKSRVKYNFHNLMVVLEHTNTIFRYLLYLSHKNGDLQNYFDFRDYLIREFGMKLDVEEDEETDQCTDTCWFDVDDLLDLKNENEERLVELHLVLFDTIALNDAASVIEDEML